MNFFQIYYIYRMSESNELKKLKEQLASAEKRAKEAEGKAKKAEEKIKKAEEKAKEKAKKEKELKKKKEKETKTNLKKYGFKGELSKNLKSFQTKNDLTDEQTKKYIKNDGIRYIYNNDSHELGKINIKFNDLKKLKYNTSIDDKIYSGKSTIKIDNKKYTVKQYKTPNLINYSTEDYKLKYPISKEEEKDIQLTLNKDNKNVLDEWKIKNIPNKKLLTDNNVNVKNVQIMNNTKILKDKNIKVFLKIIIFGELSQDTIKRYLNRIYEGKAKDIQKYVNRQVYDYIGSMGFYDDDYLKNIINYHMFSNGLDKDDEFTNKNSYVDPYDPDLKYEYKIYTSVDQDIKLKYDRKKGIMKKSEPLNIDQIVGNVINIQKITESQNCVREYLKSALPKISINTINNLGNEEGVTPEELLTFCQNYNIKLLLYDISGKIIVSNYPILKNGNSYKSIIGLYYDGHFYAISNNELKKKHYNINDESFKDIQFNTYEEINKNLKNLISNERVHPAIIGYNTVYSDKYNNSDITKYPVSYYINDNVLYINNDDYKTCEYILGKIGMADRLTPFTRINNLGKLIEQMFITKNYSSFLPVKFYDCGYNYLNNSFKFTEESIKKLKAIDHNKFWSNCLERLEFLQTTDYRTAKLRKIDDDESIKIYEHYSYIAEPVDPCLLMPSKKQYSGSHLLECNKRGIIFKIYEELECEKHENQYKNMINYLYNLFTKPEDQVIIKNIINRMIGKFYKSMNIDTHINISNIASYEEMNLDESTNYIKYDDDIYLKLNYSQKIDTIFNKRLIRNQIIDLGNLIIYDKLQSLNIPKENIIRIHTDEITFINNGEFEKIENELKNDNWKSWKQSELKTLKEYKKFNKTNYNTITDENNEISFYNYSVPISCNNNILYDSAAGCGKSYKIINDLIPSILDDEMTYKVVTPSHSSISQYRQNKLNCQVIQYYEFNQSETLNEDILIVDEFGLCDRAGHNFIIKCAMLGKTIYCFGDFEQMFPYGMDRHFFSDHYIKMLFEGNILRKETNYRNNFTAEYYDKIKNKNNKLQNQEEICKYFGNDIEDDDERLLNSNIILCKTNEECYKYNKLYMEKKNITYGDIGTKIISCGNNLSHKGIYNSFIYIIARESDNIYIIVPESDYKEKIYKNSIEITDIQLKTYFKPAYAMTFFKAQGQEWKNILIPNESIKKITNGRDAYTLISRLKEELTEETKKINRELERKFNIDEHKLISKIDNRYHDYKNDILDEIITKDNTDNKFKIDFNN
jgi:hypothetical protein